MVGRHQGVEVRVKESEEALQVRKGTESSEGGDSTRS